MTQVNDSMYKALSDNGFDGLYDWLLTFKAGSSEQINDLWKDALVSLTGLPADSYQYNDYFSTYLSGRGYVGALSDALFNFWSDIADGVIDLPSGGVVPPVSNILTVADASALSAGEVGFTTTSAVGIDIGSLTPDLIIDGNPVGLLLTQGSSTPPKNVNISTGGTINSDYDITFDGVTYRFIEAGGTSLVCESDALYDFLQANTGQDIEITAAPAPAQLIVEVQFQSGDANATTYSEGGRGSCTPRISLGVNAGLLEIVRTKFPNTIPASPPMCELRFDAFLEAGVSVELTINGTPYVFDTSPSFGTLERKKYTRDNDLELYNLLTTPPLEFDVTAKLIDSSN